MPDSFDYILDGEELSLEEFRALDDDLKVTSMIEWFADNFEDPAVKTPFESAEGGYQWVWGGPYDAAEQLYNHFGDEVNTDLIQTAVERVQKDGIYDWAPRHIGDDLPDEEEEELSESGEDYNEPGRGVDYNEPPQRAPTLEQMQGMWRRTLASYDRLEELLEKERDRALRSHNMPPRLLERDPPLTETQIQEIRTLIKESREEGQKDAPNPELIQEKISRFQRLANLLRDNWLITGGLGLASAMAGGPLSEAGNAIWERTGAYVINHRQEIIDALINAADATLAWAQHLPNFLGY
ncbi:hypothetical protein [Rhizobium leguminosarum]|uniref:hypothetical protein n=1 Tax=Rhizobium leguminosarum TaxID=384 RepID=UPI0014427B3B|nr:hypothetical protein [Rhizobium leguminosarum]NKM01234.1 hypothetical protein [Rhizobium leguminosarum bv. viciae]